MKNGILSSWLTRLNWRGASANRRIFHSAVIIAVLTLLVRMTGLAREIAIAADFGTSDQVDAYLMAFLLPNFALNVLGGSLSAAFIPTFVTVREKAGKSAADRLLGQVLLATVVLLVVATLLLTVLAPALLAHFAHGFGTDKLALTLRYYYWLLPTIVISGVISIWSAVLNAEEKFALAAFLPGLATIVALGVLLAGAKSMGIYSLIMGYLLGFVLQLVVLGWELRKCGYRLRPNWAGWSAELRTVLGQYLPMIAGAFLMSGTGLVEQFMAAGLAPGSVASLGYAARLIGVANGICAMALGTAVLPHFSAMAARADWSGVRHTLKTYRRLIFVVGGVAAVGLYAGSDVVVRTLFHRGQFTDEDARLVAALQRCYALQLPFYACGIFLVRLISALHANKYLMWGSCISLVVNIVLNTLLISRLGLLGVALSNSLMYVLSFAYLSVVVWRLLRRSPAGGQGRV